MTKSQVGNAIHEIIQHAIMKSGGNWKQSYRAEVDQIFAVIGKLSPEPKLKPEPVPLPASLLRKAQRLKERFKFTDEQLRAARDILRGVDLYE